MAKRNPVIGQIDPLDYLNQPIWCVYGPDCFPTFIHCKVSTDSGAPAVWGFSVWKRQPGFRTIGHNLKDFDAKYAVPGAACRFFADQDKALDHLRNLTKCRKGVQ